MTSIRNLLRVSVRIFASPIKCSPFSPFPDVPKEKISDETPFELHVEAKAQWTLLRNEVFPDVVPPLLSSNPLLNEFEKLNRGSQIDENDDNKGDKWLSQVEIITHSGPHRRLWMGPQFQFKVLVCFSLMHHPETHMTSFQTYSIPSGGSLSSLDEHSVEIGTMPIPTSKSNRSNSINMPIPGKSLSIESGSSKLPLSHLPQ